MKHLADEELVLYYYRDGDDVEAIRRHLAHCVECKGRLDSLEEMLSKIVTRPVPERPANYGSEVWNRIRAELPERPRRQPWFSAVPRWAWAGAVTVMLLGAFLLGGFIHREGPSNVATTSSPATAVPPARERVLMVAVGDHLDRSQILLLELAHTSGTGDVDISSQQQRAIELAASNRLYRTTAEQVGEKNVATLLEDLERVLVEIGHQPGSVSPSELKDIQDNIQSQGILFKVRVVRNKVRDDYPQRRAEPDHEKGKTI